MSKIITNLALLRQSLRDHGFHMTAFFFDYKRTKYLVYFELYDNQTKTSEKKYYPIKLTFYDTTDMSRTLITLANQQEFQIPTSEVRQFFKVDFVQNLGDFAQQFYNQFNNFVPATYIPPKGEVREQIIKHLDSLDNTHGLYCYCVKRNGEQNGNQSHRTPFNSQKTALLRPTIFEFYKADDTISFCYSHESSREQTDDQIKYNFAKSQKLL